MERFTEWRYGRGAGKECYMHMDVENGEGTYGYI